jgi:hypothetical protein
MSVMFLASGVLPAPFLQMLFLFASLADGAAKIRDYLQIAAKRCF